MYNNICICKNKVFCSKPIYSLCCPILAFLCALKMSIGQKTIDESLIERSSRSANVFELEILTLLSNFVVVGSLYITNFLVTNTVINHGCKRNSRFTVFLKTFPEQSHISFHERFCMRMRTDYFFVLPTFSQCTLKSNSRLTHI